MIAMEDDNSFDPNAVKISNGDGIFVGHVAIEQSHVFRSMSIWSEAGVACLCA